MEVNQDKVVKSTYQYHIVEVNQDKEVKSTYQYHIEDVEAKEAEEVMECKKSTKIQSF